MATQTLSTADAILKDLYVGPVVEMLNQKTYLLDQIERDADHIDHTGRRAVIPVHKNRNRGRGSTADGGSLPVAGRQDWADAVVNIRYHYYGIELTDGAIEASKSNEGAFLSLLEAETKGVAVDMRKDINRQAYGDGTGLLASDTATETSATITLDSVQYIQVGDTVDVRTRADGTAKGSSLTVTARNTTNKTITLSASVSVTAADGVYVAGNRNNEMDGLRNIVGTGRTLHSINSATAGNEYWNASIVNSGASAAAPAVAGESLFEQLADQVGGVGNGEIDVFLTSRGIRRRLADTYQSQKRYNDANAVNIHGGYSAIMVNETPVVADDDAPKGWVFGINKSALKWFEQTKPGWLQQSDGSLFHLKDGGTAGTKLSVWAAWFRWYAALGSVAPNRVGAIQYVTDDNAT